ncbi:MAG: BMC domain-containing protein [Eubacterium sp.]|nr:BMC domain-containing protein [Eubacterium sp.]
MGTAIGSLELNSIATGVIAGDAMLKAADVSLIMAQPTCPGKFIILVAGDTASVESSVKAGAAEGGEHVVDYTIIPSIDPEVIPAITRSTAPEQKEAVAVAETFSLTAAILAADYAVKSSLIDLIEVRLGRGLGGKSFVIMTGAVADVRSAADSIRSELKKSGMVLNIVIVPHLHEDMYQAIL